MPASLHTAIKLHHRVHHFLPFFSFFQRFKRFETLTLNPMGSQGPSRRPFCLRCSKPARLCLCSRLKSPPLDNSIAVTILQHSLEKNHPLNSTRVARLGLKNIAVVPVTDVNFRAQLLVRPIDPTRPDSDGRLDFETAHFAASDDLVTKEFGHGYCVASSKSQRNPSERMDSELNLSETLAKSEEDDQTPEFQLKKLDFDRTQECPSVVCHGYCQQKLDSGKCSDFPGTHLAVSDDLVLNDVNTVTNGEYGSNSEKPDFDHTQNFPAVPDDHTDATSKCRVSCSSNDLRITIERTAKPVISWVLDTPIGRAATSNGFTVKKLQRKQLPGSERFQDFIEFDIAMPPGSALLFPSGKSAVNLDAVDFEVKHLVVLDGTWAKANRMYHENPWLQLLPHLKLDSGKESLYSEVRHQPKAGCLSTIESIVCALKALGNEMEGLDDLLDVFKSMIGDQRQCKEDKFRAMPLS